MKHNEWLETKLEENRQKYLKMSPQEYKKQTGLNKNILVPPKGYEDYFPEYKKIMILTLKLESEGQSVERKIKITEDYNTDNLVDIFNSMIDTLNSNELTGIELD